MIKETVYSEKDDLLYYIDEIGRVPSLKDASLRIFSVLIDAYNIKHDSKLLNFQQYKDNYTNFENKGIGGCFYKPSYEPDIISDYKKYIKSALQKDVKVDNSFYDILKLCIENNIKNREKNLNLVNILGKEKFLKEFCTVKLDYGRQVGKTYTINQLLREHEIKIFFNKTVQQHYFTTQYKVLSGISLHTFNKLEKFSCDAHVEYFIVDEASYVSKEDLNKLYETLERFVDFNIKIPTILLLG